MSEETVTIGRVELDTLRARLEELEDLVAARRVEADLAGGRAETLPVEMVERLIAGENPVRLWREHRRLTSAELARRAGIQKSYMSEIETGSKTGSLDVLKKIAKALGVSLDDLV
jgi:DNA-binding XRE family transcriptional regulator